MSIMDNVQPAVKKETGKVAAITGIGLILMWIVFGVLHAFMPQKVPFDYTVFLGGVVGGCVAVLNFFFMGLAVQKAAAATDEDTARMRIKASYSQRMLIQMLWVILAIVAIKFHGTIPTNSCTCMFVTSCLYLCGSFSGCCRNYPQVPYQMPLNL